MPIFISLASRIYPTNPCMKAISFVAVLVSARRNETDSQQR